MPSTFQSDGIRVALDPLLGGLKLSFSAPGGNAFSRILIDRMTQAIDRVETGAVPFLVIEAEPGKVFCAGANLSSVEAIMMSAEPGDDMAAFVRVLQGLLNKVEQLPCVTVCHANGATMGGGLELALACDIRLASPSASFALPEVKLGLLPAAGGTHRLERAVGGSMAREMLLTGRALSAAEALDVGLVHGIVAVRAELDQRLSTMSKLSVPALAEIKRRLVRDTSEHNRGEVSAIARLVSLPDTQKRIAEFLNR